MNRALIFDCDGVLADTERDGHLVAFNRLFAELGLGVHWTLEEYAGLLRVAGGKERLLRLFDDPAWVEAHGLPTDRQAQADLVAAWHARKTAILLELIAAGRLPARPGVVRLAGEAHAAGWRLAVASTAARDSVRAIVAHALPAELAAVTRVFAGDAVGRKKPAPDIYELALQALGLLPGEVCVFEDSALGVRAARAAGCPTIVTVSDLTAEGDFTGAALVVDSLGDPGRPGRVVAGALPADAGDMVTLAVVEQVIASSTGAARPGGAQ